MKRPLHLAVLFALLLGVLAAAPLPNPFTEKERAQGYRDQVILAQPHASHRDTADREEAREGVRVTQRFPRLRHLRVIELDSADSVERAITRLRATGRYEFVERDLLRRLTATPNDPGLTAQWPITSATGIDIKAIDAWDIVHDAPNVVVAIVDSGVNVNHVDLTANLWRNAAPAAGINDLYGANFVGGRGTIVNGSPNDENGHGTHVAGIVGAVGNNNVGLCGVAWKVQIMAVKVFSGGGTGAVSDIFGGLDYAIKHGAHIINASYGENASAPFSQAELSAIAAARDSGIIVVTAAGNEGVNADVTPHYPAAYALDNLVSVGASTRSEALATYSNYGAAVDLLAPGDAIVSLSHASDTGTATLSGTSMAAPHVAGALALMKTQFPGDSYRQLINRVLRGVDRLPVYAGKAQSGGRLNLLNALRGSSNRPFNDDFVNRSRVSGDTLAIRSNIFGATAEPGEPGHGAAAPTATLWWEWTPATTNTVRWSTSGSTYDTMLAVYTGSALNALTLVGANDDDGGAPSSRVDFRAQAGVTYQIAVQAKSPLAEKQALTLLNLETTVANDAFATPVVLAGDSTSITATNVGATLETGEPRILDATGNASLWYRWTAPRAGRFQVAVVSDEFDPVLAVYAGSALNALTLVAASDNTGSDNSQTGSLCSFNAAAGTSYLISVDAKSAGTSGRFTLTLVDSVWQAVTGNASVAGGALDGAPAVASDGTIYIASQDRSLYAFAANGALKWTFPTGGALNARSPAIAADGTIYIGSDDGALYAVNPAGGTQRWARRFDVLDRKYAVNSSPAVAADGTIYVRVANGYLYALSPADGVPKWAVNLEALVTNASPCIAADGTVYQGSDDGRLYAVRPDGTFRLLFSTDSDFVGSPAIDATGNLYLTTRGSGRLYSVSANGTLRWTYSGAAAVSSGSPVLSADGGTVYFGSRDKNLHAVKTADGTQRWIFPLGAETQLSSPAVDSNGVVYIGADDFRVYGVNADGTLKRTWSTGGVVRSSSAIVGNVLYVGSDDHKLYAFDLGSAQPAGGPWPQHRHNPQRLGRAVFAIVAQPVAQVATRGQPFTLSVGATSAGTLTYQWSKSGVAIAGATGATLTITPLSSNDGGSYTCLVTSGGESRATTPALVTIVDPPSAPVIGTQPASQTVPTGQAATFSVVATGAAPLRYQWYFGSTALPGATDATFTIAQVSAANVGSYSVIVSNPGGSKTSAAAALSVSGRTAFLINLSVLTTLTGSQTLELGFVIRGGVKPVLIRAAGPSLATFGAADAMLDPRLIFKQRAPELVKIDENNDWSPSLAPVFAGVGAFAFQPNSKDAALQRNVDERDSIAEVSGSGPGRVLIELYDLAAGSPARLINMSANHRVGTGPDILTAGFVIGGTGKLRILIRAAGPSLTQIGGITDFLPDPKVELFEGSRRIDGNDNWAPSDAAVFTSVGAFKFIDNSRDSALVAEVEAGHQYTVQVAGVNNSTGQALVEIYELP